MNRYLALPRKRDFALLWTGATACALGDGRSFVALLWLLIERRGTPTVFGIPGFFGVWMPAVGRGPTAEPTRDRGQPGVTAS